MESTELTKKEIADIYIRVFEGLGYEHAIDSDGDVDFNIKDVPLDFCAVIDEENAEFVRICCFGFYKVSGAERHEVYKACNYSNLKTKVVKVYFNDGDKSVWAAYEVMLPIFGYELLVESTHLAVALINRAIKNFIASLEAKT